MTSYSVPIIDIKPYGTGGAADAVVVDAVGTACEQHGFLVVTGHGIPGEVHEDLDASSRAFFARPLKEKSAFAPGSGDVLRGWWGIGSMSTAKSLDLETLPDYFEFLAFGTELSDDRRAEYYRRGVKHAESFFAENIWPDTEGLRSAVERYIVEASALARRLLQIMATALELEPSWFDDKFEVPCSALSINYYPASDVKPEAGRFRRGEHRDYGALTVLYADGESGLQVKAPDGQWCEVPTFPGAYVVNLGDMMTVWSNGHWRSSLHRVVCPDDMSTDRLSVPLFFNPSLDAMVQSVPTRLGAGEQPGDPVLGGEYIMNKVQATT